MCTSLNASCNGALSIISQSSSAIISRLLGPGTNVPLPARPEAHSGAQGSVCASDSAGLCINVSGSNGNSYSMV